MWKDFFYFSKSERRAILFLLTLLFIFMCIWVLFPVKEESLEQDQEGIEEIKNFLAGVHEMEEKESLRYSYDKPKRREVVLVKLAEGIGKGHGLTNDQFQSLQAEIIVDVSAVNGDLAGAGVQTNAGHGALSTAGAIVIGILALVHGLFLLSIKFLRASGQRGRGSHHGRCGSGSVPCGRWCYRGSCP